MQLTNIKEIKGKIKLITGLHIGSGDIEMRIGGTDNPVIKDPLTNEPYIPGSSIKGKVRSLLEMKCGLMGLTDGAPVKLEHLEKFDKNQKDDCCKILRLFGSGASDEQFKEYAKKIGPTRVSFSDCSIDKNSTVNNEYIPLFEVKSENSINRIKGTAENPRFTERVPAGIYFEFSIFLKIMDKEDDLLDFLLEGLKLLEMDSLGGSGSRGYGKIKFVEFEDPEIEKKFEEKTSFPQEN